MAYDPTRYPGVPVPADWVCAFVACGQRADRPHVDGCPYTQPADPRDLTDPSQGGSHE